MANSIAGSLQDSTHIFFLNNLFVLESAATKTDTITLSHRIMLNSDADEIIRNELEKYYRKIGILNFNVDSISYFFINQHHDSIKMGAKLFVSPGKPVRIVDVEFTGNKHVASKFLKKNIHQKFPFIYDEAKIKKIKFDLESLDYIKVDDSLYFSQADSGYILIMKVIEGTLINFDFIVGYQQADKTKNNSSAQTSGHILFNFRNLFGNGRKFRLEWDKPSTFSEKLEIRYREPFIFNLPFHMEGNYQREIQDSLFNATSNGIRGIFPIGNLEMDIFYETRASTVDSAAVEGNYLQKINGYASGLTVRYNNLPHTINPRSGLYFDFTVATGSLKQRNNDTLMVKQSNVRLMSNIATGIKINYPFWAAIRMSYFNFISSKTIPVVEKKFIGGARSIRGYREQQFLTGHYFWQRNELRLMLSSFSRMHFFFDDGYLFDSRQFLKSYGFGFLIPIKIGVLQVDYGLKGGTNFNRGTLHFRLVNEF